MAKIELSRSDMGDGGWSLHAPGDDGRLLLDGPAEWDDARGDWARPDAADYERARRILETGARAESVEWEPDEIDGKPYCANIDTAKCAISGSTATQMS